MFRLLRPRLESITDNDSLGRIDRNPYRDIGQDSLNHRLKNEKSNQIIQHFLTEYIFEITVAKH
jgi:hypothetical protein